MCALGFVSHSSEHSRRSTLRSSAHLCRHSSVLEIQWLKSLTSPRMTRIKNPDFIPCYPWPYPSLVAKSRQVPLHAGPSPEFLEMLCKDSPPNPTNNRLRNLKRRFVKYVEQIEGHFTC